MTGTVITAPTIGQDPWGTALNTALAALQTQFQERIRATQTASYTAVLADKGTVVEMNKSSAGTFTVPPHSSVAFNADTILEVENIGAGTITLTPGAGVTLSGTPLTVPQYSKAFLRQTGTADTWLAVVLNPSPTVVIPSATKTANYSITTADGTIFVNAAGATTMTLPTPANDGRRYVIKNINAGTVTVAAPSGTVEVTSIAANESYTFESNGTNYYVI